MPVKMLQHVTSGCVHWTQQMISVYRHQILSSDHPCTRHISLLHPHSRTAAWPRRPPLLDYLLPLCHGCIFTMLVCRNCAPRCSSLYPLLPFFLLLSPCPSFPGSRSRAYPLAFCCRSTGSQMAYTRYVIATMQVYLIVCLSDIHQQVVPVTHSSADTALATGSHNGAVTVVLCDQFYFVPGQRDFWPSIFVGSEHTASALVGHVTGISADVHLRLYCAAACYRCCCCLYERLNHCSRCCSLWSS